MPGDKMRNGRKMAIWLGVMVTLTVLAALLIVIRRQKPILLKGAVVRQDDDARKELPIAGVEITEANSLAAGTKSDSSGFFSLTLRPLLRRGRPITLQFRHPDYKPLDLNEFVGDKIYVVHLAPVARRTPSASDHPEIVMGNVMVRYSMKTTTAVNIGSAVKTFQVINSANVPCHGQPPCSPDGKWKAAIGSASLDAGTGNEFRNARASCIAGPCPFTKIEDDGFSNGGRSINVSARNWSDTATFLLEAEVFHPMESDVVRQSYPVIFGQALNFTLPAAAEGVSIEAEINGAAIVFPLGPNLFLSWADCNARTNNDQTRVYRCELKPGYKFH
jgi:hypothetical protein